MIGAGGMGEVYKCHEIQTGAAVAIKMLLPDMAENDAALALFRREAAALHHLPHDAIVRLLPFYGRGRRCNGRILAMEFVDGRSLSDILADGPLTFEALVKLMRRIASGLQAAHERGIIHRDVSPDKYLVPLGDVTRAQDHRFRHRPFDPTRDKNHHRRRLCRQGPTMCRRNRSAFTAMRSPRNPTSTVSACCCSMP